MASLYFVPTPIESYQDMTIRGVEVLKSCDEIYIESDISKELNEYLPLIIETQNNINQKGEFKDLYTINPSYNGINALEQYEFLGVLMGICIRTGVHLTLDLCSLVWKQIVNEKINLEDIFNLRNSILQFVMFKIYVSQLFQITQ